MTSKFWRGLNGWISGSGTGPISDDKRKALNYDLEKNVCTTCLKVVLKLDLPDLKTRLNAWKSPLIIVSKIPGVSSIVRDEKGDKMTVIGTMDPQDVLKKLSKYCPTIVMVKPWTGESEKSRRKKQKAYSVDMLSHDEQSEEIELEKAELEEEQQLALALSESVMAANMGSKRYTNEERQIAEDEELPHALYEALILQEHTRSNEESGVSGSGSSSTNFAAKSTTIAPNMVIPSYTNDEWRSFCEFLNNRLRPLTLTGCRAKDVTDFLRMRQASGDVEGLVSRLSAACEVFGIKPKDNPFKSIAVAAYLMMEKEVIRDTECILVISCNGNLDVDETSFIAAIIKGLQKQEFNPSTYDLYGREHLDVEMLYRSSVVIMVLSDSYIYSRQSLNHLMAIMEHGKAKNFVIIPIYFKVTLADFFDVEGPFEAASLQYSSSAQPGRVQKWKAAMAEIASIDGHEWTKETHVMLAEEVVRRACLRLYLKNSENLV